jgi:hypothetical protein
MPQSASLETLYVTVSLILALSMASERLVEIVKGAIPPLNRQNDGDPKKEGWRKMGVQLLAVVCSLVTAFLSRDALSEALGTTLADGQIAGLGILASGGSSMWNSILVYLMKVKDLKEAQVVQLQSAVRQSADDIGKEQLKSGT